MTGTIPDGIYYDKPLGNSFCLIFLKISRPISSSDLAKELSELWKLYNELKRGKIKDPATNSKHTHTGNLSVLLGYGPKIFDGIVLGLKKDKPKDLRSERGFKGPNILPGDPIVDGSSIKFSTDIVKNHAVQEHIIIQFIAEAEMFTNRAVVETWKHFYKKQKQNNKNKAPILNISRFYTGFKRIDQRGWLGFHEGVANMTQKDREEAIAINSSISKQDDWLINGTYMAFIRFRIALEKWEELSVSQQEIKIGRKKITGCPIIDIDKNGHPISDPNCPVEGTEEVIEVGNEPFRQPPKFDGKNISNYGRDKLLSVSHVNRVYKPNIYPPSDYRSFRIFRQGFEFLEPSEKDPRFQAGLNFISFQNNPQKVMKILTSSQWLGKSINTNSYNENSKGLEAYISANAAGLFLIPAFNKNEQFPGSIMFL